MGYHRPLFKNCFYHIYNRGNKKDLIFNDESDYKAFLSRLERFKQYYDLEIYGYCLMPNHYHLIVKSSSELEEIPKFMHRFSLSYVKYFNQRYEYVGHVFQSRYRMKIVVDRRNLRILRDYLEKNPVEAGLVQDSKYYRWLDLRDLRL